MIFFIQKTYLLVNVLLDEPIEIILQKTYDGKKSKYLFQVFLKTCCTSVQNMLILYLITKFI